MTATRFSYAHGDNVPLAIAAILVTVLALSVGDAMVKGASASFTLWQLFVLRSVFAAPLVAAIISMRLGVAALMPRHPGWTATRSLLLAANWIAYYLSLPNLDLSVAAAAYYTLPLFITLFAALFIGERVGVKGWIAVCSGFCGVILVLRPQGEAFNLYALSPLAAAVLFALAMILTRTKCRGEHPLVLSLGLLVAFPVVGGLASLALAIWDPTAAAAASNPFLFGDWTPMGRQEWRILAAMTVAIVIGSIGAAIAYQAGPASVVAGFDFAYVFFAAAWGILFFNEAPDAPTLVGMAMIVGAGLLAARR